jgi:hypothetical protein
MNDEDNLSELLKEVESMQRSRQNETLFKIYAEMEVTFDCHKL